MYIKGCVIGKKVLFSPAKADNEPAKSNAGKVGEITDIMLEAQDYPILVRFGTGLWSECWAAPNELVCPF